MGRLDMLTLWDKGAMRQQAQDRDKWKKCRMTWGKTTLEKARRKLGGVTRKGERNSDRRREPESQTKRHKIHENHSVDGKKAKGSHELFSSLQEPCGPIRKQSKTEQAQQGVRLTEKRKPKRAGGAETCKKGETRMPETLRSLRGLGGGQKEQWCSPELDEPSERVNDPVEALSEQTNVDHARRMLLARPHSAAGGSGSAAQASIKTRGKDTPGELAWKRAQKEAQERWSKWFKDDQAKKDEIGGTADPVQHSNGEEGGDRQKGKAAQADKDNKNPMTPRSRAAALKNALWLSQELQTQLKAKQEEKWRQEEETQKEQDAADQKVDLDYPCHQHAYICFLYYGELIFWWLQSAF